ncbi:MAG TPA: M4 family metallopeptidase [Holophagaceae bacterium]|nr:M4 family metallopeptidase [Holophagaceae bacterium]
MRSFLPKSITVLGLALAAGTLSAQAPAPTPLHLRAAQAQEAGRTQQAQAYLQARLASFGLTAADAFQVTSVITNPQGEAVVRFTQMHQGFPVFGTSAVVRVGAGVDLTSTRLEARIADLPTQPRLTPEQALSIAHMDLTPTGTYAGQPTIERLVFPAHQVGTVVPRREASNGTLSADPLRSVAVGALSGAHVGAYHVTRRVVSDKGALTTLHAIVDSESGVLLRKWATGADADPIASGALLPPAKDFAAMAARRALPIRVGGDPTRPQAMAKPRMAADVVTSYSPAVGTANTFYAGTVQVPTAYDSAQGGWSLLDVQRGIGTSAWVTDRGLTPGNRIITEQMDYSRTVYHPDGLITAYYYDYTLEDTPYAVQDWSTWPPTTINYVTGSLDNTWGNGQELVKQGWSVPPPFTDEGKTAAGEAMHAITTVYDVMNQVLNRKSYDGLDTSIIVQVNDAYSMQGKAYWIPDMGMIQAGIADDAAWGTTAGNVPVHNGAELTAIARELGVAMHQSLASAPGSVGLETQHLQRATGALFTQLAEAYAQRQPGDPANQIPSAAVDWTFGRTRADGRPWFWMDRPSRDGISPDAYFDGIWMLGQGYVDGISFGDGPMNRAWYFLAQGASATPGSNGYSAFLPQGMMGIGLQKTALIAYKALTERYDDFTDYRGARAACLAAAADLHGAGSAEVAAVANAFAAVNIGAAQGGQEPVSVAFQKNLADAGSPLAPLLQAQQFMFIPTGEWVRLKAHAANATDGSLDWRPEGVPGIMVTDGGSTTSQGTFNAAGLYRAPDKGNALWSVQAWSRQDPRQFAQGAVWAFDTDGDGDGTVDALDFADFTMLCYLPSGFKDFLNPHALFGSHTSIGDPELQLTVLAFNNAFNQ